MKIVFNKIANCKLPNGIKHLILNYLLALIDKYSADSDFNLCTDAQSLNGLFCWKVTGDYQLLQAIDDAINTGNVSTVLNAWIMQQYIATIH